MKGELRGREGPAPAPESSKHGERQTRGAEDVVFEMSKAWRIQTPNALKGSIRESWGASYFPSRVRDKSPGEKTILLLCKRVRTPVVATFTADRWLRKWVCSMGIRSDPLR